MMNAKDIIENFSGACGIWTSAVEDGDLVRVAEYAMANNVRGLSVAPDAMARVWTWLENTGILVYVRFYLDAPARSFAGEMSNLCASVRTAFVNGADGVQIFIKYDDLSRFVDEIAPVRDDLFFNKTLCIGIDITDMAPLDWPSVWGALGRVRADAVIFAITKYNEKKSDFVGRLYGAFDAMQNVHCDVHFMLGNNWLPMEQANRLVQKMRPEMSSNSRFWVRWES